MNNREQVSRLLKSVGGLWLLAGLLVLVIHGQALAFTLHVIDGDKNTPIAADFRWMVEVDNTFETAPGAAVTNQASFAIHNSYAPLAVLMTDGSPAQGDSSGVDDRQLDHLAVPAGYVGRGVGVPIPVSVVHHQRRQAHVG